MTDPDVVFAMFVDSNPLRDAATDEPTPDVGGIMEVPAGMETRRSHRDRYREARTAALALLLVLAVGGLWMVWPKAAPDVAGPASPEGAGTPSAISTIEAWLLAVNAGDIDRVMALSAPDASSEADRRVAEWQAGLAVAGMPIDVRNCVVASVAGSTTRVECQVRLGDLVAAELGTADLVAPFDVEGGLARWRPYTGGDISAVNDAYASYLRLFHRAEYEGRCAPTAYSPGTVIVDRGLALTGECAELAASVAADVAQWLREGRPEPGA